MTAPALSTEGYPPTFPGSPPTPPPAPRPSITYGIGPLYDALPAVVMGRPQKPCPPSKPPRKPIDTKPIRGHRPDTTAATIESGEDRMTAPAKPLSDDVQRLMRVWADSLHTFTDADLAHEAERVEIFEPSPMADFMRHAVDDELAARHQAEAGAQ